MSAMRTVTKSDQSTLFKARTKSGFFNSFFYPYFCTLPHSHPSMSYSCTQLHTNTSYSLHTSHKYVLLVHTTSHKTHQTNTASHGHVTFEFDAVGGLELASILVRGYPSGYILQELQQSTAILPFTVCSVPLLTKSTTEAGKVCFCLNVTVMNTKSSLPTSLF